MKIKQFVEPVGKKLTSVRKFVDYALALSITCPQIHKAIDFTLFLRGFERYFEIISDAPSELFLLPLSPFLFLLIYLVRQS